MTLLLPSVGTIQEGGVVGVVAKLRCGRFMLGSGKQFVSVWGKLISNFAVSSKSSASPAVSHLTVRIAPTFGSHGFEVRVLD